MNKTFQRNLFPTPNAEQDMATKSDLGLVIAFVAPVGVDLSYAEDAAEKKLVACGYHIERIRITHDVLPNLDSSLKRPFESQFERYNAMMDAGNQARMNHSTSVIAVGVASAISLRRRTHRKHVNKIAYFVHSLKHPDEVRLLKSIYSNSFYLIGVHASAEDRRNYLIQKREISESDARRLMMRDRRENQKHGQRLVDTFHLSDFFVGWRHHENLRHGEFLENSLARFIEIILGHPNRTPTFGEYAMFLAFSAALRSSDLSRQVGAVVTRNRQILGTGANDCPRAGGGLYWQTLNRVSLMFEDSPKGRDWTRGFDSNRRSLRDMKTEVLSAAKGEFFNAISSVGSEGTYNERQSRLMCEELIRRLSSVLDKSSFSDLTEFGRMVHAEMDALLSCAREGISTRNATLFSTTFPCHNCAKHIVASGIKKVVFVEPYLKSKALKLHDDSIMITYADPVGEESPEPIVDEGHSRVRFEPFVGVGPRRFFDLFSMNLGVGEPLSRKDDVTGTAKTWDPIEAKPRIRMAVDSFLDREESATEVFQDLCLGISRLSCGSPDTVPLEKAGPSIPNNQMADDLTSRELREHHDSDS